MLINPMLDSECTTPSFTRSGTVPCSIAVGETLILLHPLPLVAGVSIGMERGVSAK